MIDTLECKKCHKNFSVTTDKYCSECGGTLELHRISRPKKEVCVHCWKSRPSGWKSHPSGTKYCPITGKKYIANWIEEVKMLGNNYR